MTTLRYVLVALMIACISICGYAVDHAKWGLAAKTALYAIFVMIYYVTVWIQESRS